MQRLLVPCLFLATVLPAQANPTPSATLAEPHHLVEVTVQDARYLARLLKLDLDLAGCGMPETGAKRVEVVATDADIRRLRGSGLPFRVVTRNLEDHYEAEMRRQSLGQPEVLTPPLGQGAMGGHWTLQQMVAILDSFAAKHPTICSRRVSLGKSIEGRDIWMVKISDNVGRDENEPEVLYDALHHAREPLSMEATILFMDELLDGYGTDPEATFLVNERELYFVPCVNPDGYEYNRSIRPNGGGLWRKNRRRNSNGTFGVDLNRNYATGWSAPNGGNSTNPDSNTYRGTKAFSEPETLAIENFVKSRNFVQICSCHTYTEILLQPWGYKPGVTSNSAEYDRIGDQMTKANPMRRGGISTILYTAAGGSIDHHHAVHGAYGWTPELGKQSEGGFWPAGQTIVTIARRHQPMFRAMALTSGPLLTREAVTLTELSGNGNGVVEAGEVGAVVVRVRNDGALAAFAGASIILRSRSSGAVVVVGTGALSNVPKFGTGSNSANPVTFRLDASYSSATVDFEIEIVGDGQGTKETVRLSLLPTRTVVTDDMERDRGFARAAGGTATTGRWERGLPVRTTYQGQAFQPGGQHTPGGRYCWVTEARAGSSVGSYDVDRGYTDLLSPVLDLSHLGRAEVEFYRWYAESTNDDAFVVSVSRDGGSTWSTLLTSAASTGGWVRFREEVTGPLTKRMRFRMRAQDLNASLVEAAIDDFVVRGAAPNGSMTILSSGVQGSTLQLGLNGQPGARATLLLSLATTAGLQWPGIDGTLFLDPARTYLFPGYTYGTGGFSAIDLTIPTLPGLSGTAFHWQTLYVQGTAARFGNLQTITVK